MVPRLSASDVFQGLRHNTTRFTSLFCHFFCTICSPHPSFVDTWVFTPKLSATCRLTSPLWSPFPPLLPLPISPIPPPSLLFPLPISFFQFLSFFVSLCLSLTVDRYLGLNWLKGEKKPVKLRRQAVGREPAYLPDLFMLQE